MPHHHRLAELDGLVGTLLGHSGWVTVDQPMIDSFAAATGDHQWIHVDRARAEREIGGTIAHGYLTLSLIPRLTAEILEIRDAGRRINYGLDRVRFPAPVPAGSRLRLALTLAACEAVAEGRRLALDAVLEREGAERPACAARCITLAIADAFTAR
ncbi:MAG: MaoC family dehydratase [Pseudomonadota bacterium]